MSDDEIMDLVYEHADCFSSHIQFTDQGILNFARAINGTDHLTTTVVKNQAEYTDTLWSFVTNADRYMGHEP